MRLISLAVTAALATSAAAQPVGCPTKVAFDFPDRYLAGPVRAGPQNTLLFTGRLRVNTDGAPNSYHPMGRQAGATNSLCNAISVVLASGEKLSAQTRPTCDFISRYYVPTRDSGWAVQPGFKINWFAIATRPVENGHYRPCIQTSGKTAGYFVSMTRLPTGIGEECQVEHWINAETVPYITLPGGSKDFAKYAASPGDLALVHRAGAADWVVAVVADTGNSKELGEGSPALHRRLGSGSPSVQPTNIASGVSTILFAHRQASRPITPETLETSKPALLAAIGGDPDACLK